MHKIGIEQIISIIIPVGERNRWSEESIKKMRESGSYSNVPKLLVEFAAVSQVGKILCESTYSLEGDDPLGATC